MKRTTTVITYDELEYGFQFGAAKIERLHSYSKRGSVVVGIETPRHQGAKALQVYVTKTGKVRIFDNQGEWMPPKEVQG